MFDHMGVSVRDLHISKIFYEKALAPLNIKLLIFSEEWGAGGYGYENDRPRFWIGHDQPHNGEDEVHICFSAKNREEVRAFYHAALQAGGRDLGAPGLRPMYHEHYYGAFILDPDGNNIEACCHLSE